MRRPNQIPLAGLLFCAAVVAQPSSNGYLLAGAGARDAKLISQAALGGEWVIGRGIGVGGELGVAAGHDSSAFVSVNAYYHLAATSHHQKIDPFVTGGYTSAQTIRVFGGSGSANRFNAGGGINFWLWRRLGLRAEFRDIVAHGDSSPNVWAFRGGVIFH